MKQSPFQKWYVKNIKGTSMDLGVGDGATRGWNGAILKILRRIQYRNRIFEGNWQHEDIDTLISELKEMLEE
jgi:hypothetical protein